MRLRLSSVILKLTVLIQGENICFEVISLCCLAACKFNIFLFRPIGSCALAFWDRWEHPKGEYLQVQDGASLPDSSFIKNLSVLSQFNAVKNIEPCSVIAFLNPMQLYRLIVFCIFTGLNSLPLPSQSSKAWKFVVSNSKTKRGKSNCQVHLTIWVDLINYKLNQLMHDRSVLDALFLFLFRCSLEKIRKNHTD